MRRPRLATACAVLAGAAAACASAPSFGAFDHLPIWAGLGDSYSSGEGIPGAKGRCQRADHRGTDATAWAVGARERLENTSAFEDMVLVACTGALNDSAPGQLGEATVATGRRDFDLVTFSFGGNNIGFADVLHQCFGIDDAPWGVFNPGCDVTEQEMKDRVDMLAGEQVIDPEVYDGSFTLPRLYDHVASRVAPGGDVVVVGYPQLIEEPSRWPRWLRFPAPICQGIGVTDARIFRGVIGYLNQQIGLEVEEANHRHEDEAIRFHFVDIAHDPYEFSDDPGHRHGLCSRDHWINGVTLGNLRPQQSFHPTQEGHDQTARVVANVITDEVRFDDFRLDPSSWELTPDGIGPLLLGMSEGDARAAGIELSVEPGPFCNTWSVPGLDGVTMAAPKTSGQLESIQLVDPAGHGAAGIEVGEREGDLQAALGDEIELTASLPELDSAFYRLLSSSGDTAVQFSVNTKTGEIMFEEAGYVGQFYSPDGTELCA